MTSPVLRLQDRWGLVTGASGGIGRALAVGMAAHGAHVMVHHFDDPAGAAATASAVEALGRRAAVVQADVRDVSQIEAMYQAMDALGPLGFVVNNAGITGWNAALDVREELWDRVIDTNLKGTFFSCLAAARRMRGRGGAIVNVSTQVAALAVKNLSVYAISKAGINGMTRQLAVELAPEGVRLNALAPGPVLVERNLLDDPHYEQTWGGAIPLGRVAQPHDLVGAAVFLASDDSRYVTGQVLYIDGGWSAQGVVPAANVDRALARRRQE